MSTVALPSTPAAWPGADRAPAVRADGVVRRFGERVVLDALDLEIDRGQFVILLGQSGCGKSTLLRLLGGLDRPDGGSVTVPRQRAIVFQTPRLLPWQRVWRNVTIGVRAGNPRKLALAVLAEVGLEGHADAWPKTLSGGEAQRVALARALVADPALVLLDEPFAALDALTRLRMHALIRGLRERHDATMLMVTHDVDEAIALGDRILVLRDGRIARDRTAPIGAEDRSRGPERDRLRADLLSELGLPPSAA
jgi:sulfonate transport system ATP-binding protein